MVSVVVCGAVAAVEGGGQVMWKDFFMFFIIIFYWWAAAGSVEGFLSFFSSDRSSYSDSVLLLVQQLFQILSISANISNFSLSSLSVCMSVYDVL